MYDFWKFVHTKTYGLPILVIARSASYVPVPANVNVRLSVRPSVRHRFLRFLRRAYELRTPSDPLRKTSTLVSPDPFWKIYPRMLPLMSKFYDHFFAKKCIFIKKVPSFTRYKNLRKSPKLVLTDSVILIDIVLKVLFSS